LQDRFYHLVQEHEHVLNAAASGLSALPGTAKPFACTQALWRFLANDRVTLPALIEPVRETARSQLAQARVQVGLIVHDWSMLHYGGHTVKGDRLQRTHKTDLGYELATALLVEPDRGTPLGPLELRVRCADGVHSTRASPTRVHAAHVDELLDVMAASRTWGLDRPLIHIIDREADSVGHDRAWHAAGHQFVVRADAARRVRWNDRECLLPEVAETLGRSGAFTDMDSPLMFKGDQPARLDVAETLVVLDRPAIRKQNGQKVAIPGEPIRLRLVISRVVAANGQVLAEWLLLTNVSARFNAARIVQWYYWRWRIESYHKLLKSAGQQVEQWGQETGLAIAKRLVIASMACLTVWTLQREESAAAGTLRRVLVRLSGRQMKWGVASTAPALLAGLEKLLAMLDILEHYDPDELRCLVRHTLPFLFNSS
jgi:hypothetical protein